MSDHRVYNLNVRSDVRLSGLAAGRGEPDVHIRKAELERLPADAFRGGQHFSLDGRGALYAWQGFATVRIRRGCEILYERAGTVEESWLQQCLLGPSFGMLLHQRGLLVLHASAVEMEDGRAVAFVGQKGAGKSTTAAAMHTLGCRLVADDIVALNMSGAPQVLPGPPQVKLWPDAASAVHVRPDALDRLHSRLEKRIWNLDAYGAGAARLSHIYALDRGDPRDVRPLTAREAFVQLIRHSYAPRFVGNAAVTSAHLDACSKVASTVSFSRLSYPTSLGALPGLAAFIKHEYHQILRPATTD